MIRVENQEHYLEQKNKVSPWVREVRKIEGYTQNESGQQEPVWGEVSALWYAPTGKLLALNPDAVEVWKEVKLGGACYSSLNKKYPDQIVDDLFRVLDEHNILNESGIERTAQISDTHTRAEAYLHLTQSCNYSCAGCCTLSDVFGGAGAKTLEKGLAIEYLDSIIASSVARGYSAVTIKWAGGEPTLKRPFRLIQELQPHLAELQEKYPQILIEQSLLTNGSTLTPEKIDWLVAHNIEVAISFWGIGERNDQFRKPRNKKETFTAIKSAIQCAVEKGLKFNVLTVITPENAEYFDEVIRFLWDQDDPNYIFFGKEKPAKPLRLAVNFWRPQNDEQRKDALPALAAVANGVRRGIAAVIKIVEKGYPVSIPKRWDYLVLLDSLTRTCGSGDHYLGVGPNGIGSCHEEMADDNKDRIALMREGANIFDVAALSYPDLSGLRADRVSYGSLEEITLLTHGGAGCPRSRLSENGTLNERPVITMLYAALRDELLALYATTLLCEPKPTAQHYNYSFQPCAGCVDTKSCGLTKARETVQECLETSASKGYEAICSAIIQSLGNFDIDVNTERDIVSRDSSTAPAHTIVSCPTSAHYTSPDDLWEEQGYISVGRSLSHFCETTIFALN